MVLRAAALALFPALALGGSLSGSVVENGAAGQVPVAGAAVAIRGTDLVTASAADGTFSFSLPDGDYAVVVDASNVADISAGASDVAVAASGTALAPFVMSGPPAGSFTVRGTASDGAGAGVAGAIVM